MHPLSDRDRSHVETTMRLLRAASREAMAAGDVALANVRHIAAVECGALLDERTPKEKEAAEQARLAEIDMGLRPVDVDLSTSSRTATTATAAVAVVVIIVGRRL
jgi:hypothetical protein